MWTSEPYYTECKKRFWPKVKKTSSCWLWQGYKSQSGYGIYRYLDITYRVHRLVLFMAGRDIPNDKQIDHLCRVRHCVNPKHLEIVDQRTNILRGVAPTALNKRKTACIHGHSFTNGNLIKRRHGWRGCRTCMRKDNMKSYYKHHAKRLRDRKMRRHATAYDTHQREA